MIRYLFIFLYFCIGSQSFAFYHEFKIGNLPKNVNTLYLRDALRYLSLASNQEQIIDSTFNTDSNIKSKLLTFSKEGIRVLIIKDLSSNTQIVNIISLQNAEDLHRASIATMAQGQLFTFPVNSYYNTVYAEIREVIIRNIHRGVVKINTLGTASVYGTLLAIELSSLQIPVESIILFGGTRFTDQKTQDGISNTFGSRMLAITHEHDLSHKMQMKKFYAETLMNESIICENKNCNDAVFQQTHFTINELLRHSSNTPHEYAAIYHDSLLKYNEKRTY
jgi:hypothetical protein